MTDRLDKEEYRVLARKYRPQKFSDLIGQDMLVSTLTNSINTNRIAHAYLLTGVRGVGKTTSARIIAMSLNCLQRLNDTSEPCGNCDSCNSVREDHNLDVIEMDAASKTGVDDIREIIDNVKYKPINSKYKIFIIDEVHMLSKNAFNALLKTLEEPPSHVKFIFATTEVNKIPITIISRCQRFDLHRIQKDILSKYLMEIALREKIDIKHDAMALIVRSADGSVRDGLSLLDQATANEKDQISINSITQMLGLAERGNIFNLIDAIFNGNAVNALRIYNNIYESGADVIMIFDEMLSVTHFITQIKLTPELKLDIHIPELERTKGFEISEKMSMASLGIIWQVLFKGYQELQSGFHLLQHGEMIIIRLIYLYDGPSPDELLKKINLENSEDIKKSIEFDNVFKKELSKPSLANFSDKKDENLISNNIKNLDFLKDSLNIKSYRHFVDLFFVNREGMLHTHLYNNVKLVSFKEGELTINVQKVTDSNFIRTIGKLASRWTGRIWQINVSTSNIGQSLYEEDIVLQKKEIEIMKNDKEVKNILEKFPGVNIHSITDINKTEEEDKTKIENKKLKEKKW